MIKKTLWFSNPSFLSLSNGQLIIKNNTNQEQKTIPIEDIGVVVLDHQQITITHGLLSALAENNTAVITCNNKHMPIGLLQSLDSNTLQSERYQNQIKASLPLRKQLWQQTISQKIANQASALNQYNNTNVQCMRIWSKEVKSGDKDNLEGRAAVFYWSQLMKDIPQWTRDANGDWPNSLFNYGYAILRAIVARALVASGLLPTLGIHHHNRYNAYCLADDIMEPYRPYIDLLVLDLYSEYKDYNEITSKMKLTLLSIPTLDVTITNNRRPLMIAVQQTTASLAKCFNQEQKRIEYPELLL